MKDWQQIVATQNDSIHKVMEILNDTGLQIVIIVDESGKLIGTVTDGDIRRGLLKGVNIEEAVSLVMHRQARSLPFRSTREEIQSFMEKEEISHLPLVDQDSKVVFVTNLSELLRVEKKENYIILMAGGLGARLASLTQHCPKPMLKVGGKPILETIIESFRGQGFYKFAISVNYKSDVIENYFKDGRDFGVQIEYLKEPIKLGTAGALSLFHSQADHPFIVMNGDILTKIDFVKLLETHQVNESDATMCVREYTHQVPFGIIKENNGLIEEIEEKPVLNWWVSAGVYAFSPKVLKLIPKDLYYDMPSLFKLLIGNNGRVNSFKAIDYWLDIGRIDDFEKANFEFDQIFK